MIKKFTLLFLFAFIGYQVSIAQMFMGGWIQYRHLNNHNYEVQLHVFRDCSYGQLPQPEIIVRNLLNSTNIDTLYFNSSPITYDVYQKNLLGNTLETRCDNPPPSVIGIKRMVFTDTLSFIDTNGICNILLSYLGPNYSSNLQTTINTNQAAKIELNFNACGTLKTNSSPSQNINNLVYFNHVNRIKTSFASVDSFDQDSVRYVIDAPLTHTGTINYNGNFNSNRFITFLGFPNSNLNYPAGLKLDAYGNLGFMPTRVENGLIGIKVSEYRKINGVDTEISSGIRVFPLIISPFAISETEYTHSINPISITACQNNNTPYRLEINHQSGQTPPIVKLTSSFGYVPHQIKIINSQKIELNIYFDSLIKSKIKDHSTLILNIVDTAKISGFEFRPIYMNQTFNIPVKIGQDSVYNISTSFDNTCNVLTYSRDKTFGAYQNTWEISQEDSLIYRDIVFGSTSILKKVLADTGWYKIKASTLILGCDHIKDTTIYVNAKRQKILNTNAIQCLYDSITANVSVVNQDNNWNYYWIVGNDTFNNNSLSKFFDSSQFNTYRIIATNTQNSCKDSATGYIFISDYKKNSPDSFKVCGNQIFNFTSNARSKFNLTFDFNNQGYTQGRSTSINIDSPGFNVKNYKVNEGFLCYFDETIVIENLLTQTVFKADTDTTICSKANNGYINFRDLVNSPDSIIKYEYQGQITLPEQSIPIQNGKAFLKATHISGCTAENEYLISVIGSTHLKNNSILSVCRGIGNGLFTSNPININIDTFGYYSSTGFSPNSLQFDVLNSQDSQIIFYTKFQGCETYDTIKIIDFEYKNKINVPDQLCSNEPNIVIRVDSGFFGGEFYLNDTLLINTIIPSTLINNNFINYKSFINAHIQCEQKFNFNVNQGPIADFSADITEGIKPLSVNFQNNSSGFNSFMWLLPNSNIDSVNIHLNYVFNEIGRFDIGIVVINDLCGTDFLIKSNYIWVKAGVSKNQVNPNLKVYPNPVNNKLFIELMNQSEIKSIKIYDLQGKLMYEKKTDFNSNIEELDINLADGSYLLEVNSNNKEVYFSKFIVTHP